MIYLKIINFVLSTIALLNFAEGNLTVTPGDIEVLSGRSSYFNCSTSFKNKDVRWYFYAVGSSDRKIIYAKGKLTELYVDRFNIDNSSEGAYNLVIPFVTLEDAGRYVCHDDEGYGDSASAEQIVIDGDPVCNTPETTTGFVGDNSCGIQPDIIQLSCSIKYHGNRHPMATWRKSGDKNPISVGVNYTKNSSHVDYMLTMNADISLNNNSYFCETTHSGFNQYRCRNAITINILYALNSNNSVVNKTKGDEIKCSSNSSVPCNYKWKRIENGNEVIVSNDDVLKPDDSTTYKCEAECSFYTTVCTLAVMAVQVFSAEASSGYEMMALLVIPIAVIIVVTTVVVGLLIKRRIMNNRKSNTCGTSAAKDTELKESLVQIEIRQQENGLDSNKVKDSKVVHSGNHLDSIPKDMSYPRFAFMRSSVYNDRKALIDGTNEERFYTYADLWRNVRRFAEGLRVKGLKKGNRVCVVLPNCIEYPVIYFGITSIGCIVVPLNSQSTAVDLQYFFKDAEPDVIVCSPEATESVLQAANHYGRFREIFYIGDVPGYTSYESLLLLGDSCISEADQRTSSQSVHWDEVDPKNDILSLCYSSGTTGLPKGCMHTHFNFIANVLQMAHPKFSTFTANEDVTITTVPMFHMFGVLEYFGRAFYQGCILVVLPKFNPESHLQLINKYKATVLLASPPIVAMITKSPLMSSVRRVVSAAAPLRDAVVQETLNKISKDAKLCGEYGMTECLTISNDLIGDDFIAGSVGHPLPGVSIKVVDALKRCTLGPEADGEICVKSPAVMIGYWKSPEVTKVAFDSDGFMLTGDIGHYDKEGRFYVVDRKADIMNYDGHQVNPGDLEPIILSHPRVNVVAVVGKPDKLFGDLPTAFVVIVSSKSPDNDEQNDLPRLKNDIINFVASKVAPWKRLCGGVRFVDSIPKSASGKVLRNQLRRLLKEEEISLESKL